MKQATFAIIGVGGIAQSQHLPNSMRAPHLRLKTVCDLREDVLKQMQDKYEVPNASTDYKEVLADDEIDAVIVATREDAQAKLAIEAMEAGKHVYVEKPLAETAEECRAVTEVQERTGQFLALGFNRRFAPSYRKAKELVQADGGAKNIHYRIADDYVNGWGKGRPGGLRLIHEVCHVFDILRWLTESEVKSIYCIQSRWDDDLVTLQFASGAIAVITSSGYATCDMPKERLEVISNFGAVTVEEFVELRTFGYPDAESVYRFAGHSHPDREYTHRNLYASVGAEALLGVRRQYLEAQWARDDTASADALAQAENAYYEKHHKQNVPMINYMVDKGWVAALDHFAECVATGKTPQNARAADAYQASLLSHAAIESRDTGKIVTM